MSRLSALSSLSTPVPLPALFRCAHWLLDEPGVHEAVEHIIKHLQLAGFIKSPIPKILCVECINAPPELLAVDQIRWGADRESGLVVSSAQAVHSQDAFDPLDQVCLFSWIS